RIPHLHQIFFDSCDILDYMSYII
ncbi:MAG: hypothetical protein H6Q41_4274, partial [Deltaproteobacteria bacterium]|nr:hypothetical protein [Deltaproteobacteria bacterium]